jgi:hypothetical protein
MRSWWPLRPNQLLLPENRNQHNASAHPPHKEESDASIVQEFRSKLRLAEEMIEKLRFNLREIREARSRRS